ncbi:hypothetical protein CORC01_14228 [Colletotrichum orchidophilum]|uniref:Aminoglycoside phosphotransferase domain-containing protein n=1 Tax=Colletotrichum orchidophilum TaxID=1209926 RepID=A0A1G4AMT6_9PEZI|nr:uncharacterized protein CORC01_14228 [Colletotrichum orchidophilum]OHE90477.1 hypothetical protein CORC01_14228 [Colletotrichum orchidophilum]
MGNHAIERSLSDGTPQSSKAFSGYRWTYHDSLQEGPIRSRAESFSASVDWSSLLQYAARRRNGTSCRLLRDIGLGYNHMVRIIQFDDGVRWVARLRMPPIKSSGVFEDSDESVEAVEKCEYNTISLVRQWSSIPIPEVHAIEARWDCDVKAPFMLMDCLPGNVGMDLGMKIPPGYKPEFLRRLAQMHVQLAMVQLPMIGTIVSRNEDGTYRQGPIRGLGGPFNTATEFFKAWAAKTTFGMTDENLRTASGQYADEIIPSVLSFPKSISNLASKLSTRDHGPFPLCHGDFGHNNIIVDDEYRVLGLIDWEASFAGPWEVFADFPLTLSMVPPSIDVPWNYNEQGDPVTDELKHQLADQKSYVAAVKEVEDCSGTGNLLSDALKDCRRQQLVTAMRLYQRGKVGWYSKLVDDFT